VNRNLRFKDKSVKTKRKIQNGFGFWVLAADSQMTTGFLVIQNWIMDSGFFRRR